jgi:hypothetical protein
VFCDPRPQGYHLAKVATGAGTTTSAIPQAEQLLNSNSHKLLPATHVQLKVLLRPSIGREWCPLLGRKAAILDPGGDFDTSSCLGSRPEAYVPRCLALFVC